MNSIEMWYEDLPTACPPADAAPCNGLYYRLIRDMVPTDMDFVSQRNLYPDKAFVGVDECLAMSLSIFDDMKFAQNKLKLPKFRNYHIAQIRLQPSAGVMKKTFGPSHHSWWRSGAYTIEGYEVL